MDYWQKANKKLDILRQRDDYLILAIESSCDETAVAITRGKKILSNKISSQIDIHRRFGGVVPEIASRNHILAIDNVLKDALDDAGVMLSDIDAVAVTYGAGLLGALLVGVAYAKSLAYALELPLIAVNHIKGHIAANFITDETLSFPFICLLASGGHTAVLKADSFKNMEILGTTCDDAAGEAFDKVARVLGLPYPGGPQIEACALSGKPTIPMPRAFKGEKHLNFSYSGLKTAVINYVHNTKAKGGEINAADLARSFQDEAVGVLIEKAVLSAKRTGISTIALAGGVGANSALRQGLVEAGEKNGIKVLLPPKSLCTDNAAMIGVAAFLDIAEGALPAGLELDADASLR